MEIFQVIPRLEEGGAERFVVDLCNSLTESYPCHIVLIVFYNLDRSNILVKELSHTIEIIELKKRPGLDLSIVKKINHLVKERHPDIIHTHLNAFEYMFFTIMRYRHKINFVHTLHNSPNWLYRNIIIRIINHVLFRSARVTPVIISSDSISEFNRLFPQIKPILIFNGRPDVKNGSKIESVQNEVKSYKITTKTRVFINIARISQQKNQLMLVEAFNQLIKEGKDVILLIVGPLLDKEISDKIREQINYRIHLLGYKENPADYLKCSDGFCLSSFHEGMPISLIEAIQNGVIPICTPAGGIKDIINPKIGFISQDFSTSSYIDSLKEFLNLDNTICMDMSARAKSEYEHNYTMQITASKYMQLYKKGH